MDQAAAAPMVLAGAGRVKGAALPVAPPGTQAPALGVSVDVNRAATSGGQVPGYDDTAKEESDARTRDGTARGSSRGASLALRASFWYHPRGKIVMRVRSLVAVVALAFVVPAVTGATPGREAADDDCSPRGFAV